MKKPKITIKTDMWKLPDHKFKEKIDKHNNYHMIFYIGTIGLALYYQTWLIAIINVIPFLTSYAQSRSYEKYKAEKIIIKKRE